MTPEQLRRAEELARSGSLIIVPESPKAASLPNELWLPSSVGNSLDSAVNQDESFVTMIELDFDANALTPKPIPRRFLSMYSTE